MTGIHGPTYREEVPCVCPFLVGSALELFAYSVDCSRALLLCHVQRQRAPTAQTKLTLCGKSELAGNTETVFEPSFGFYAYSRSANFQCQKKKKKTTESTNYERGKGINWTSFKIQKPSTH